MQFEFNNQLTPQNLIEIEEIGQFGLEAWNDLGYYYYMLVRTVLGTCVIATCGPIIPDIDLIPSGYRATLDKMPYKEDKLAKNISMFLNDRLKGITDARTLDFSDAAKQFRELRPYLENFSESTF